MWVDVEISIGKEAILVAFEVRRHGGLLWNGLETIIQLADRFLLPFVCKINNFQRFMLHKLASAILKRGLVLDDNDAPQFQVSAAGLA